MRKAATTGPRLHSSNLILGKWVLKGQKKTIYMDICSVPALGTAVLLGGQSCARPPPFQQLIPQHFLSSPVPPPTMFRFETSGSPPLAKETEVTILNSPLQSLLAGHSTPSPAPICDLVTAGDALRPPPPTRGSLKLRLSLLG